MGEPEGGVSRYRTPTIDDAGDTVCAYLESPGELSRDHAQFGQLLGPVFPWMYWTHCHLLSSSVLQLALQSKLSTDHKSRC